MFNIGPQELLLILVLALMVVGPKRLPEIARSVGKGVRELRKAQDEVRKTIQVSLDEPAPRDRGRSGRRLPVDARAEASVSPASTEDPAGGEAAAAASETAGPVSGSDAAASAAATSGVSEVSRTLGRTLAELRRAREEVQRSFRVDLDAPVTRPRGGPAAPGSTTTETPTGAGPEASARSTPTDTPTGDGPEPSAARSAGAEPPAPVSDDPSSSGGADRPS